MELLISEYSSGFADSTSPLCCALSQYNDLNITYISDKNNTYMDDIDNVVHKKMIFDVFANDEQHKKGTFRWALNRVRVAIGNCIKRNRYVKKYKPDVTLIELTMASIDCHYIKRIKPYTKIVYTVHDVIVPIKSMSWSKKSLKKMYAAADAMVVHTEANKLQLINDFEVSKEKITVIPHGVETEYSKIDKSICRKELGINDKENVLLFYGGIRESKGLDVLLDALKGLDVVLIIAGAMPYGESFDRYRKMIVENDIRTVEFLTFTDDSFRDILFQAADYLVLPYKDFSSQSGVLMQSIRYHLPVIATDVGAFKEYIEKYNIGYSCSANNIYSLQQTIEMAFKTKQSFENNCVLAAEESCWSNSARMYRELFLKMENKE